MFGLVWVWFIKFIKDTDVNLIMTHGYDVTGKWAEPKWLFKAAEFYIMWWGKKQVDKKC